MDDINIVSGAQVENFAVARVENRRQLRGVMLNVGGAHVEGFADARVKILGNCYRALINKDAVNSTSKSQPAFAGCVLRAQRHSTLISPLGESSIQPHKSLA